MSLASFPVENQSAEWRQRVELAACYRLLAHYKMTDLIYTPVETKLLTLPRTITENRCSGKRSSSV